MFAAVANELSLDDGPATNGKSKSAGLGRGASSDLDVIAKQPAGVLASRS
jgi:hypothetical protein